MPKAQAFRLTGGLVPHQVLQRGPDGKGAAELRGESVHAGRVEARVLSGKETLLDWTTIAELKAADAGGDLEQTQSWSGTLAGIPTGGEYTLELRVLGPTGTAQGGCEVKKFLVGDVWVLGGQSNMEGCGLLSKPLEKSSPKIKAFSMNEKWETAAEPLHWLLDSPDSCHWDCKPEDRPRLAEEARRTRKQGAGLGLTFAKELLKRTGVPIGLIPCAHGGTSMEQWNPARASEGGKSLYGSMLRRIEASGKRVRGMLWYQGESETLPEVAEKFSERFRGFVASVRRDLAQAELPFYYVQIGRLVEANRAFVEWNRIQDLQRTLAADLAPGGMVASVDLSLDDLIHISTEGLQKLGQRLADHVERDLFGNVALQPGPQLKEVRYENSAKLVVRVRFDAMNGALVAYDRLSGFSVHAADGAFLPLIFDAALDTKAPGDVILKLTQAPPAGATLHYGVGLNPFCNLQDERSHAAPVFGPVPILDA